MARPKTDREEAEKGAGEPLYVPPRRVPSETEYPTLDNLSVRLAADIDPRCANTEVPQRRPKHQPRRINLGLAVGTSAVISGIALGWALFASAPAPSPAEASGPAASDHSPVEAMTPVPSAVAANSLQSNADHSVQPNTVGEQPVEVMELVAGESARPAASGDDSVLPPAPTMSAQAHPLPTRSPAARNRRVRGPKSTAPKAPRTRPAAAPAPSNTAGEVWIKPPGRKVWMK